MQVGGGDGSAVDTDRLPRREPPQAAAARVPGDEAEDGRQVVPRQSQVAANHAADEEPAIADLVNRGRLPPRLHFEADDGHGGRRPLGHGRSFAGQRG